MIFKSRMTLPYEKKKRRTGMFSPDLRFFFFFFLLSSRPGENGFPENRTRKGSDLPQIRISPCGRMKILHLNSWIAPLSRTIWLPWLIYPYIIFILSLQLVRMGQRVFSDKKNRSSLCGSVPPGFGECWCCGILAESGT